jgi:hypothetical protein
LARRTTTDQTAAHRKLDQRRDDLRAVKLRKRALGDFDKSEIGNLPQTAIKLNWECYHNGEKLSTYVPVLTADGVMPDLQAIAFSSLVTSLVVPAVILALAPLDIMVPWVGVGVVPSFV